MSFSELYVDTSGSDNNAGTSAGSAKSSGTQATVVSGNPVVVLLPDNPDLSTVIDYQDYIRLDTMTDGIRNTDTYQIIAHDNGALVKTVTVKPTPGSSASLIVWAIGGAWATIQRSVNIVSSVYLNSQNDPPRVNIKSSTYAESNGVSISVDTNDPGAGTPLIPITFQSYGSTLGDGTKATITYNRVGVSPPHSVLSFTVANAELYMRWVDIRFTQENDNSVSGTIRGCSTIIGNSTRYLLFQNCEAVYDQKLRTGLSSNTEATVAKEGIACIRQFRYSHFINCLCENLQQGSNSSNASCVNKCYECLFVDCVFQGGNAINIGVNTATFIHCLLLNAFEQSIWFINSDTNSNNVCGGAIINCTVHNNTSLGFEPIGVSSNTTMGLVYNTIVTSGQGNYAINIGSGHIIGFKNFFPRDYENQGVSSGFTSDNYISYQDKDDGFVQYINPTNDDYRIKSSSAARSRNVVNFKNVAIGYFDTGAIERQEQIIKLNSEEY